MPKNKSKDISVKKIENPKNPRVIQHVELTKDGFEVILFFFSRFIYTLGRLNKKSVA